jgi:hypothetical protein
VQRYQEWQHRLPASGAEEAAWATDRSSALPLGALCWKSATSPCWSVTEMLVQWRCPNETESRQPLWVLVVLVSVS